MEGETSRHQSHQSNTAAGALGTIRSGQIREGAALAQARHGGWRRVWGPTLPRAGAAPPGGVLEAALDGRRPRPPVGSPPAHAPQGARARGRLADGCAPPPRTPAKHDGEGGVRTRRRRSRLPAPGLGRRSPLLRVGVGLAADSLLCPCGRLPLIPVTGRATASTCMAVEKGAGWQGRRLERCAARARGRREGRGEQPLARLREGGAGFQFRGGL